LRKVFEPNKNETKLDAAITQLYLLKHALETDPAEKLEVKINDIRAILLDVKKNFNKKD
tara:strand:- start:6903 stop:7079 length:177 start_codon:yes stop_codon:yes gene_type:complete